MNDLVKTIKKQFSGNIRMAEKRPGIFQLLAPFYHEDGDMLDIFLEKLPDGKVKISDHGMTIMRISYDFDLDSEPKESAFQKILSQNLLKEDNGRISMEISPDNLAQGIFQFVSGVGKAGNIRLLKREVAKSVFPEALREFVFSKLEKFHPKERFVPLQNREELEVDFALESKHRPVFIYGIKDASKARLATIQCLEFEKAKLRFLSVAVHESMEELPGRDQKILTNAIDKQFSSMIECSNHCQAFLDRQDG